MEGPAIALTETFKKQTLVLDWLAKIGHDKKSQVILSLLILSRGSIFLHFKGDNIITYSISIRNLAKY